MKFRNTVQLGALLAILILAHFGWKLFQTQSESIAQEAKRLFQFEAADIRQLSIAQLDAEPTTGVQDESGVWAITAPNPSIQPNTELWKRVAAQAATLLNERTLPDDALDLKAFGIEVPRLTIQIEAKGQEHTLRFGYLEPTQTCRYARLDEGPVFLVKKEAVFELDRPLDLLREANIVDAHDAPVLRFEFAPIMTAAEYEKQLKIMKDPPAVGTEADNPIIVERPAPDAPWVQLSPVHTAANQDKVNELVKEIQFARGRSYIDAPESLADYGLEPANARITVDNGEANGGRQTFYFGDVITGENGGVYVRKDGEPAVFLMDGHITTLFPRMNALRERRILTRAVKDAKRVDVNSPGGAYTLERNAEGAWHMTNPPQDDTDEFYVSQYFAALKNIEGLQFFPEGPEAYGLDAPETRLAFQMQDGTTAEIRFTPNPEVPEQYYALTDAGEVAALPAERVQFLRAGPGQFRNLSLLRFAAPRAVKMQFQIDGVEYILEKAHNQWRVSAPADRFMPNQRDAEDILQAVADLRAVTAESEPEADPAVYGFDAPRLTMVVTLAPGEAGGPEESLGPLVVGAVVPDIADQRFAQTSSRTGVFRVTQSFIEKVSTAVAGIRRKAGAGTDTN